MTHARARALALFLFTTSLFAQETPIYRLYDEVPIASVLFELANLAKMDVIIGDDVRGLVSTRIAGPPFEAFRDIARAYGLVVRDLSGIAVVGSRPGLLTDAVERFETLGPSLKELKVSLTLSGVHLPDIFKLMAREVAMTWIVRPPVGARVWARLRERPLPQVLAALALVMGVRCETRHSTVVFFPSAPSASIR